MKYIIVMCGGCGKTNLFNKYPNIFLDIDHFIWNFNNKIYRKDLLEYCENGDIDNISKLYKKIMNENHELRNDPRIILTHHPDNAKELNRICLDIVRPNKFLHLKNINSRDDTMKQFAINDYNNLKPYDPFEFDDYNILEERLLSLSYKALNLT